MLNNTNIKNNDIWGNLNMRKIDKDAMAKGYEEMANINLVIAQEDFHLEEEGAKLGYEMDTTKGKGEAK